jgi:predicted phosphodiesterase
MKIGILADIHSNLEALQVALEKLAGVDRIVCLGDVVGYGPCPNECCDIAKSLCPEGVIGNHDMAVVGKIDPGWFNHDARKAVQWTAERISQENAQHLGSLPARLVLDEFELAHGSPEDACLYIVSLGEAYSAFEVMERDLCFFGHTHVACCIELDPKEDAEGAMLPSGGVIHLQEGHRYLINPGSVGQPRDGNPHCAFAVCDLAARTVELIRAEYPIEETQKRMRAEGLPEALSERLRYGY